MLYLSCIDFSFLTAVLCVRILGVFVFGSLIGIEYTKEQLKREKRARSVIDLPMMSLAPSSQPQAEVGNQANSMEMDYEGDDTHGYRCNSQSIQQLASKL